MAKKVDTVKVADVTEEDLASMMVGRQVSFKVDKKEANVGDVVLKVDNLVVKDNRKLNAVKGLSLELHRGEILGIAGGVDGNGQSEFIEGITGLRPIESGRVILNGKDITNLSPKEIIENGMNTIPEDRQKKRPNIGFYSS